MLIELIFLTVGAICGWVVRDRLFQVVGAINALSAPGGRVERVEQKQQEIARDLNTLLQRIERVEARSQQTSP